MAEGKVPESLLKKRQRDEGWAAKKATAASEAKKKAKDSRKLIFKKAEAYVKEYRQQVRSLFTRPSSGACYRCAQPTASPRWPRGRAAGSSATTRGHRTVGAGGSCAFLCGRGEGTVQAAMMAVSSTASATHSNVEGAASVCSSAFAAQRWLADGHKLNRVGPHVASLQPMWVHAITTIRALSKTLRVVTSCLHNPPRASHATAHWLL
jgi:hypothetical protein